MPKKILNDQQLLSFMKEATVTVLNAINVILRNILNQKKPAFCLIVYHENSCSILSTLKSSANIKQLKDILNNHNNKKKHYSAPQITAKKENTLSDKKLSTEQLIIAMESQHEKIYNILDSLLTYITKEENVKFSLFIYHEEFCSTITSLEAEENMLHINAILNGYLLLKESTTH